MVSVSLPLKRPCWDESVVLPSGMQIREIFMLDSKSLVRFLPDS